MLFDLGLDSDNDEDEEEFAEHAAPRSESPVIEELTMLVKTGAKSSATANRKLVMGE